MRHFASTAFVLLAFLIIIGPIILYAATAGKGFYYVAANIGNGIFVNDFVRMSSHRVFMDFFEPGHGCFGYKLVAAPEDGNRRIA